MTEELIRVEQSTAPALPSLRLRLEQSHAEALKWADDSTDLADLFNELAADGAGHDARHALRYEFDLEPRDLALAFDHVNSIESAWHALQQAERRALRTSSPAHR